MTPMNRPGAYNSYCPSNRQEAAKASSTSSKKRKGKKREGIQVPLPERRRNDKRSKTANEIENMIEIEKNRLIQEEHQKFRDCESNFLALIRRWEDAVGNKNTKELSGIENEYFYIMENFTVPFIVEYGIEALIRKTTEIFLDTNDKIKRQVTSDKFFQIYRQKRDEIPNCLKEFKAKKVFEKEKKCQSTINGKDKSTTAVTMDNNVILNINTRNAVKNEKLRKILRHALLLGSPQYGQQFRAEMEKENRDRQVEIAEALFEEIRKCKDPPFRFLRLLPNTDTCFVEEAKEKVCSVLIHVVRRILKAPQPRENDVLQLGGQMEDIVNFYDSRGNKKFREVLKSEGYYEEYSNARLSHHVYRMERIIKVLNNVLGRVQDLSPPTRFLFRGRRSSMWMEQLDENRRLLTINITLAQNNEKKDDFSISGHDYEPWSLKDTNKLKGLVIRTGKYEYFKEKLQWHDGSQIEMKKIAIARKLLFMIRILNPHMRYVSLHNFNKCKCSTITANHSCQLIPSCF